MTDGSIRASDKDRESVVSVLREAYTEGRLTLDEFDERTSTAYASRTWGELRELTVDLPTQPVFGVGGLPQLSPVKPEAMPPALARSAQPPRRSRPLGPLLPIVFVWALIAAATSNPAAAAALACLFICLLAVRIANSGRW
jgi:hypothetical protein